MASREAAKSFFFFNIFFFHCIEMMWEMMGKKEKNLKNVKTNDSFGTYKLTRAVDRKQNNF